jgi:hypothetical protein
MRLRLQLALFLLILMIPALSRAQDIPDITPPVPNAPSAEGSAEGEVTAEPICFNVINRATYNVYGTVMTNIYTTPDGTEAHHRSNFRLGPSEKTNFCTSGPFFEGRKIDLTLRTLVPIFSCKTAIDRDIIIYGREKPTGGTQTWADCH